LGLWCLAEGSVFECFDMEIHVVRNPPCAAEYWVAGIDYGASNPFTCILVGVCTGNILNRLRNYGRERILLGSQEQKS